MTTKHRLTVKYDINASREHIAKKEGERHAIKEEEANLIHNTVASMLEDGRLVCPECQTQLQMYREDVIEARAKRFFNLRLRKDSVKEGVRIVLLSADDTDSCDKEYSGRIKIEDDGPSLYCPECEDTIDPTLIMIEGVPMMTYREYQLLVDMTTDEDVDYY